MDKKSESKRERERECEANEFKDECKLVYRFLWMDGQIFRGEREVE